MYGEESCFMISFRPYCPEDLPEVLALFYRAVHTIPKNDYTPAQLDAWAPYPPDADTWGRSLAQHYTQVAVENGKILGFSDLEEPDYLDRLYVLPEALHLGIARELTARMEKRAQHFGATQITVHASKTALGFFLHQGYKIAQEQTVQRHGIILTNYAMKKDFLSSV